MYKRILEKKIVNNFFSWKIIMLLWARQIWKTTLVEKLLNEEFWDKSSICFSWDDFQDVEILNKNSISNLSIYVEDKDIIFIDEWQKIRNIWNTLKILIDKYKNKKQIIVTGSSSINLLDLTSEALTWRKIIYNMYSISSEEIIETKDILSLNKSLENLIIYWSYPDVLNKKDILEKKSTLKELANSSLYRDILEFQQVRNSDIIMKLLKLLALQIWKEVSLNELANNLWVDIKTVMRYIDLLEKSFIIFRLAPYFTNKRKELNKTNKIYFYDLWIRNSILNDFNLLENRNDIWDLWENFLIIERIKHNTYFDKFSNNYFRRTYNGQEIDFIENYDNKLYAYEFKWWKKIQKMPKSFKDNYVDYNYLLVNKDNYIDFITWKS